MASAHSNHLPKAPAPDIGVRPQIGVGDKVSNHSAMLGTSFSLPVSVLELSVLLCSSHQFPLSNAATCLVLMGSPEDSNLEKPQVCQQTCEQEGHLFLLLL